jgi:hypothetical protein
MNQVVIITIKDTHYISCIIVIKKEKKIHVLVKECFGAVLPEPVEGMRDRWAG